MYYLQIVSTTQLIIYYRFIDLKTSSKKTSPQTSSTEIEGIETDDIILDQDLEEDGNSSIDLEDNLSTSKTGSVPRPQ